MYQVIPCQYSLLMFAHPCQTDMSNVLYAVRYGWARSVCWCISEDCMCTEVSRPVRLQHLGLKSNIILIVTHVLRDVWHSHAKTYQDLATLWLGLTVGLPAYVLTQAQKVRLVKILDVFMTNSKKHAICRNIIFSIRLNCEFTYTFHISVHWLRESRKLICAGPHTFKSPESVWRSVSFRCTHKWRWCRILSFHSYPEHTMGHSRRFPPMCMNDISRSWFFTYLLPQVMYKSIEYKVVPQLELSTDRICHEIMGVSYMVKLQV